MLDKQSEFVLILPVLWLIYDSQQSCHYRILINGAGNKSLNDLGIYLLALKMMSVS